MAEPTQSSPTLADDLLAGFGSGAGFAIGAGLVAAVLAYLVAEYKREQRRQNPERATRRNLDMFVDAGGVHPIRSSIGYVEWLSSDEKASAHRSAMRQKLGQRRRERGGKYMLNPEDPEQDKRELARAKGLATRFHGRWNGFVLELDPEERQQSRYVVALGEAPALEYAPGETSKRGGVVWRHQSGDRGRGAEDSPNRPLLAVDPITRRPLLVPMASPMRFNARLGLVG